MNPVDKITNDYKNVEYIQRSVSKKGLLSFASSKEFNDFLVRLEINPLDVNPLTLIKELYDNEEE